jgi:signal transduction histidine kinase
LIDEVLDFQKLSANKMTFDVKPNDIVQVINDACHTMMPHAKKKKVNLLAKFDSELPQASFDNDKMIQVLTNLISNAIKFTPEKGRVTVSAKQQGEDLAISVSDTGMGMPKEALPKIFDQFYRVHQQNQQIKGTGLGLAIVKKIVDAHKGRLEVESETKRGTTFTAFIPLSTTPDSEALTNQKDNLVEEVITSS